jgi:hypothetical protein
MPAIINEEKGSRFTAVKRRLCSSAPPQEKRAVPAKGVSYSSIHAFLQLDMHAHSVFPQRTQLTRRRPWPAPANKQKLAIHIVIASVHQCGIADEKSNDFDDTHQPHHRLTK